MVDKDLYQADEEINTTQASTAAKVNRRTIVAWIHASILPATRRPGQRGHYRIRWQDLYDVLHSPAVPPAKE